jgi:hypothetical protein
MRLEGANWSELERMAAGQLLSAVFSLLVEASGRVQRSGGADLAPARLIPRLLELRERRAEVRALDEPIATLARSVGLWNFVEGLKASFQDQILSEAARIAGVHDRVFHREQWRVLDALLNGRNVILTAPRSFGKELVLEALISSSHYSRVALVATTDVALDAIRNRLIPVCTPLYDVVSGPWERQHRDRVIFVGREADVLKWIDHTRLDLLVVDDSYGLEPAALGAGMAALSDGTHSLLNAANQFLFIGWNIETVSVGTFSRNFEFITAKLETVAVDKLDLSGVAEKDAELKSRTRTTRNWPALVYASSPTRADRLVEEMLVSGGVFGKGSPGLAEWLSSNFSESWSLVQAVAKGLGVHHDKLPRSLAAKMVDEFNRGNLGVLVCTTSLIKGATTAARSVFIFDEARDLSNYDFFDFVNFPTWKHGERRFVGSVFLFHKPKDGAEPVAKQAVDVSDDETKVVVDLMARRESADYNRNVKLAEEFGLRPEAAMLLNELPIISVGALKQSVERSNFDGRLPIWRGYPSYHDVLAVNTILCTAIDPLPVFGVKNDKQLSRLLQALRFADSLRTFFRHTAERLTGELSTSEIIRFLDACQQELPHLYELVQLMINTYYGIGADFAPFVRQMTNLFRSNILTTLDAGGLPVQIAERVYRAGDTTTDLAARLRGEAKAGNEIFTAFERAWITSVLPIDTGK